MNCLKCGKETPHPQVFCDACLQVMDRYPVDRSTPILLTPRTDHPPERTPRRRKSNADIVRAQRKVIRWLCIALAALTLIVGVLAGCLFYTLNTIDEDDNIGKNYTTIDTAG